MEEESIPTLVEEGGELPIYGSEEAAGADIRAHIEQEIVILPGERKLIPTGLRFEIPRGYEIQVRSRSGLALKHGITVLNAPGTIDSDYRGEIGIILFNHSNVSFTVTPKMRIAQLVLAPVYRARFLKEEAINVTKRGEGGFGHTGMH